MSITAFLQDLADGLLPRIVPEGADLDRLRILRAAGWVVAEIPRGRARRAGVVSEVTFAGLAVLEKCKALQRA